ncbi:MAG: ACP S-malonyltransferase [Anaerolineae bacterium]|nr:ACP S-malonyltransferase [Anaerolineae bacterium]MCB9129822.1 ACP S-malonyltransferase [Anaerolineales bacterium]MCB0234816.1 ACP S-malonyltransferase [Anaerolineae bacterium]MCB0241327.1 ACP S-malonyltransferase [Anaerolineae bacterium]MCB0244872.1 ACP S-malonyltransferase [Anaerolineae bacterium]
MSQSLLQFALLFPGQGSQAVGMARELADSYTSARDVMAEADDTLGFSLSTLCFDGPEEVLTDTINAQPALMAASVAALRAIHEAIPDLPAPAALAGHSMGEYSALVAAGSLSYADGLRLVRERGRLMKEAGERSPGGMAAVLGMEIDGVDAICAEARTSTGGVVQVANDNCPGQVVISGDDRALEDAMQRLSGAGARKVVRLAVSIAAHSPLMAPAAAELQRAIEATDLQPPAIPVIGNVHAMPLQTVEDVRADLVAQLTASVRWTGSMRLLAGQGINTVVEVGSGDVLSNLMKRIERDVRRLAVGDPSGIERLRALMTE